jgi:4-amino-4-deoxy-L-arabinose transferase-like glycosyltransferase
MVERPISSRELTSAWILAAVAVLVQVLTNHRYGYFRDELYFIACGEHLAFGYVDFAPLAAWLIKFSRGVFGDSLPAIRLLPALANGAEVVLTGLITRELGGKRFAIFLSCLAVLVAPVVLGNATRFSMNPFEPLFWMGCIYFLLLAINRHEPRRLVWCGVLLGLGLENKHSTAFFLLALIAAMVLTSTRGLMRTKWFWIAAVIVVVLALPNVIWEYGHQWATWVDLSNVKKFHKNVELPPLPFLGQQIMMLLPLNVLVWVAGLGYLLFHQQGRPYRVLGICYLLFLAQLMALHGKDYYLAPTYPMLFAAGGVFWEGLSASRKGLGWLRVALPVALIVSGLVAAPLVLPLLPPDRIPNYMEALGIKLSRTEIGMKSKLPQHFADQFGWQEMVAEVAGVYNALPPEQRSDTAILAGNYGSAGAIDFFGARHGLPKSISAHQNYYLWGYRNATGDNLIMLNWNLEDAQYWCNNVEVGPRVEFPYTMSWEHYNILICHGLKKPMAEAWPHFKVWN